MVIAVGTWEFLAADYRQAAIWYESTYLYSHIEAYGRQINIDADYLISMVIPLQQNNGSIIITQLNGLLMTIIHPELITMVMLMLNPTRVKI